MPGNYSKLVTVISGQTITAAERNNEFDNVINNMTPDGVDDASANLAAMQATTDPAGGSLATDLRGELRRLRFQILKTNVASGNWYDAMGWLSAITPASPGATATDLLNRLAQIISFMQSISGTTWPTAPSTNALLKGGGTMSGNIAMGTNKLTGLAAGSTAGDSVRYEQVLLLAGGTMAGDIAMGTNKLTGLGAGTAAGHSVRFEQLKVFQCVTASSDTNFDTTNTAFQNTNLSCNITPGATSRYILVLACGTLRASASTMNADATISNDAGGNLGATNGFCSANTSGGDMDAPVCMVTLHNPASTSAQTYRVQVKARSTGTATFGRGLRQRMVLVEVEL